MEKDKTERDKEQSGSTSQPQSIISLGSEQAIPNEQDTDKSADETQGNQHTAKDGKGPLAWFRRQRDEVKAQIVLDFVLVLITALYAFFAILQWRALNRQASGIEHQVARMAESIAQTQTLIDQQREALDYAKIQADVAKQALQDARRSTIPVVQMGGWDFKPDGFNTGKITASVSLANRGSADVTNGTDHIVMEIRKDEPPLNYQPPIWKVSKDVTIQRNDGERSFEVSRTLSQSEVDEIRAEHKFICVFGFLDYSDPLGSKIRKRFCVKYGSTSNVSTARECETWQGQESDPK